MPAWKTFDESTAAALKQRVDAASVSVEAISQPIFSEGDAVVIAPTLQKGAALVITARKKSTPVLVEEPAQLAPSIEEIAAPQVAEIEVASEPIAAEAESNSPHGLTDNEIPTEPTLPQEPEFTFGPTTWERADQAESLPEFSEIEREDRSTDPEIWDLPSQAPFRPTDDDIVSVEHPAPTHIQWEEERYVATGFLGLDNYVEDEEEIARAKRPWWKKIFSD